MQHATIIDSLFDTASKVLLDYVEQHADDYGDGRVPTAVIKKELNLNKICVHSHNKEQKSVGWVFAYLARRLEDEGLIVYHSGGPGHKSYLSLP